MIKELTTKATNTKQFELKVPIGDTKETQVYKGELRYIKNADTWLVQKLEPVQ